jgi:hypothetical protein
LSPGDDPVGGNGGRFLNLFGERFGEGDLTIVPLGWFVKKALCGCGGGVSSIPDDAEREEVVLL